MNLEKFTERSRGFLQAAQTIAMRESHQRLAPEHLLKALMDDDQGLASNLISRAGGAPAQLTLYTDRLRGRRRFLARELSRLAPAFSAAASSGVPRRAAVMRSRP